MEFSLLHLIIGSGLIILTSYIFNAEGNPLLSVITLFAVSFGLYFLNRFEILPPHTITVLFLLSLLLILFKLHNTYTVAPGETFPGQEVSFAENKRACHGYTVILNANDAARDLPTKGLCIGYLTKADTLDTGNND